MATTPAKRRNLRPPLRIECARGGGRPSHFLGYGANLSETGVFIQSLALRDPGTRLRLVMHLSTPGGEPIATDAEVRWVRRYGGKRAPSPGMGLRFLGLKPSDKSYLHELCSAPVARTSAEITPKFKVDRREPSDLKT
ncbi:MAG TPA: PilZ domain-containing protein [Myxococcota bacterium]|nr:PilZ domain-containing protein [Myxococcota bacterium]